METCFLCRENFFHKTGSAEPLQRASSQRNKGKRWINYKMDKSMTILLFQEMLNYPFFIIEKAILDLYNLENVHCK
jgi:hypothetical protein